MAASYPSSVKSFSTKATNDTIQASHVDDLQDEVMALESALLTGGLAHDLVPSADNLRNFGSAAKRWIIDPMQLSPLNSAPAEGRLSLTSGTPVTTSDVTAATTLYYAPYVGNRIALYDGTRWILRTFSEISIAVPATTSQMYDVWAYDNSGTLALELTAWTNDSTRATAITRQDGVYVKSGTTTRRYVGSFRTTGVSGQTEDSATKRFLWNYYNRVDRAMLRIDTTDSWNYTTASYQQANASSSNQIVAVIGVAEDAVELHVAAVASNTNAGVFIQVAIGDASTTPLTNCIIRAMHTQSVGNLMHLGADIVYNPAIGYREWRWLERSTATGTTTWYGDNGSVQIIQSGIFGRLRG